MPSRFPVPIPIRERAQENLRAGISKSESVGDLGKFLPDVVLKDTADNVLLIQWLDRRDEIVRSTSEGQRIREMEERINAKQAGPRFYRYVGPMSLEDFMIRGGFTEANEDALARRLDLFFNGNLDLIQGKAKTDASKFSKGNWVLFERGTPSLDEGPFYEVFVSTPEMQDENFQRRDSAFSDADIERMVASW